MLVSVEWWAREVAGRGGGSAGGHRREWGNRERSPVERVHLVCFRLRLHGRTPAAYDVRLVTSRMNQPSYSFRALADRRLVSPLRCSSSRASSVPLLPRPRPAHANRPSEDGRIHANDFAAGFLYAGRARSPPPRPSSCAPSHRVVRVGRARSSSTLSRSAFDGSREESFAFFLPTKFSSAFRRRFRRDTNLTRASFYRTYYERG